MAQGYEPIGQSPFDHEYQYRKRGAPRPKVRMARPPIEAIRHWADLWAAELRRNRDGSYDALLEFNTMSAWEDWRKAASEIPGPGLCAARYTVTFPEEALLSKLPGSAIGGEEFRGAVRVIGTRYVYVENANALLDEVFAPSDGVLDETKAGLVVLWGGKDPFS